MALGVTAGGQLLGFSIDVRRRHYNTHDDDDDYDDDDDDICVNYM